MMSFQFFVLTLYPEKYKKVQINKKLLVTFYNPQKNPNLIKNKQLFMLKIVDLSIKNLNLKTVFKIFQ